jgi:hypothetical protein
MVDTNPRQKACFRTHILILRVFLRVSIAFLDEFSTNFSLLSYIFRDRSKWAPILLPAQAASKFKKKGLRFAAGMSQRGRKFGRCLQED